jgi:hypothetical protein
MVYTTLTTTHIKLVQCREVFLGRPTTQQEFLPTIKFSVSRERRGRQHTSRIGKMAYIPKGKLLGILSDRASFRFQQPTEWSFFGALAVSVPVAWLPTRKRYFKRVPEFKKCWYNFASAVGVKSISLGSQAILILSCRNCFLLGQ